MVFDPRTDFKTGDLLRWLLVGDPHVPSKYAPVASSQPPRISSGFEISYTEPNSSSIPQTPVGWFRSIMARRQVGDEVQTYCDKIALLPTTRDEGVLYFFREDLSKLVHAAALQPPVAHLALKKTLEEHPQKKLLEPWMAPIQIACGDFSTLMPAWENLSPRVLQGRDKVYLAALHHTGFFKPREMTHLTRRLFETGPPATRVLSLEALTLSAHLGKVQDVNESFVRLMAATTPEERDLLIYPALLRVIGRGRNIPSPPTAEKVARLTTLLRGWLSETSTHDLGPDTLAEIQRVLV